MNNSDSNAPQSADAAAVAEGYQSLSRVLDTLLGPDGCPWDREQTPDTLCEYLAEETFELIDAIRRGEAVSVRDEMGDVMFLLLFIAKRFGRDCTLDKVLGDAAAKMIRRHPHVFADASCENREELLAMWEAVKKKEKQEKKEKSKGVFASLPEGLPPMAKAYRVHAKAARAGFTWDSDTDVEQQVEAEWLEWLDASLSEDLELMEHEMGDLLFTMVELARRKGVKANAALHKTVNRFLDRFAFMEKEAEARGSDFTSLDMEGKNELWEMAKAAEKNADKG